MKQIQITKTITDRTDESVTTYLTSIAKLTPLQADEEAELARQISQGDRQALEKLIRANLRFVVTVAKQFQSRGLDLADLIEEGNIGLCKAAERFDGTRGVRFISFAVSYIQQAILDALAEKGRLVRLPHGQVALLNKIRSIQSRYEQGKHRAAEIDEIARELDIEPDRVQSVLNADRYACRLDAPLTDDSGTAVSDYLSTVDDTTADALLEQESITAEVDMLLHSTLRERDIYVIRHLYGLGCEEQTLTEIADQLGLSRESIRQIRDRALIKLRGAGSARTALAHSA